MNRVVLSGRLFGKAFPFGEGLRGVRFLLRVPYRYVKDGESKEAFAVVPCVIFHCPDEIRTAVLETRKEVWLEGEGRINRSSYDTSDGEKKYSTDVVLNPLSVGLLKA